MQLQRVAALCDYDSFHSAAEAVLCSTFPKAEGQLFGHRRNIKRWYFLYA